MRLVSVCFEMTENEEKPTAVYPKKVHKGGFDEVNRVISKRTLVQFNKDKHGLLKPAL
jgi:hypothetical protein